MQNLFLPIYNNLEKEVIKLSENIHFDDNQLNVYSIKIAELLIRIVIEIETLSKELYFKNGGQVKYKTDGTEDFIYFDTDCINHLESMWVLSKKEVLISATNFYFIKTENNILTPLNKANKRGSSSADWAKAYQAVKHDRSKNLQKASIKNLIRALAALYLLNIYNRNDKDVLNETKNNDLSFGSNIFSVTKQMMTKIYYNQDTKEKAKESFVCVEKYPEETYRQIIHAAKEDDKIHKDFFEKSPEVIAFFSNNPTYSLKNKSFTEICTEIGGTEFLSRIVNSSHKSANLMVKSSREIVLNKNQQIYPTI